MDNSTRFTGEEWQRWANNLLQRHYGPGEYQKIPDEDKGDAGLEGFAISTATAYQVYGPEGTLNVTQRYNKHRTKMTNDINKFINNKLKISKIIGTVKIKRWVLLVPVFDSRKIVEHAAIKTKEVLEAKLPYVDTDNFRVCLEDEEAFSIEREKLLGVGLAQIDIGSEEIPQKTIESWIDKNDRLVATLNRKSQKLPTLKSEDDKLRFRCEIVKHLLNGQNALEDLRRYPFEYEKVRCLKSQKERYLATQSLTAEGTNSSILRAAISEIRECVAKEVKGLSTGTIDAIAHEAVADWLIRCPLDFPELRE